LNWAGVPTNSPEGEPAAAEAKKEPFGELPAFVEMNRQLILGGRRYASRPRIIPNHGGSYEA
jgi:hypothetical protein